MPILCVTDPCGTVGNGESASEMAKVRVHNFGRTRPKWPKNLSPVSIISGPNNGHDLVQHRELKTNYGP